ncbi:unnamed protein product [Ranitomeya imitator]|uniref:RRM domain-containing protein n=1 Tax=Ranitomeya imitator TaxID=111125 RepID=A0ABN9KSV8_9NEOB|nr:unnamed protein product [Ranitomeya imitator]
MSNGRTAVIQVTNLSAAVTSEQMRTLFSFLGDVEELRLYPPDNAPLAFSSKVCYIKFGDPSSVGVAQHLTNTVFIDRALIVVPCAEVGNPLWNPQKELTWVTLYCTPHGKRLRIRNGKSAADPQQKPHRVNVA